MGNNTKPENEVFKEPVVTFTVSPDTSKFCYHSNGNIMFCTSHVKAKPLIDTLGETFMVLDKGQNESGVCYKCTVALQWNAWWVIIGELINV